MVSAWRRDTALSAAPRPKTQDLRPEVLRIISLASHPRTPRRVLHPFELSLLLIEIHLQLRHTLHFQRLIVAVGSFELCPGMKRGVDPVDPRLQIRDPVLLL